jgi:hypothetical protein
MIVISKTGSLAGLSFLLTLTLASAAAAPVAPPRIDVHVERSGDAVVIAASASLDADVGTAWSVLTDYARYRNFIPGVQASRVVARRGTSVVVEQSDELAWWIWRVPVRVTFEIDESAPARLHSHARAASWPSLDSTFMLEPSASGIRLDYVGRVGPGMPIVARLEQPAVERAAVRDFAALAAEIERRSAASRTAN